MTCCVWFPLTLTLPEGEGTARAALRVFEY